MSPKVDTELGKISTPGGAVPVQTFPQGPSPQAESKATSDDDSYGPSLPPVYSGLGTFSLLNKIVFVAKCLIGNLN